MQILAELKSMSKPFVLKKFPPGPKLERNRFARGMQFYGSDGSFR